MEQQNLEKLIGAAKQGDIKSFEQFYNATFDDISARLDANSSAIEAAYNKLIATIGSVSSQKDIAPWMDKAVDFVLGEKISESKKLSKQAIYKKVIASKDAEIRFQLKGAKLFIAGLTKLQKTIMMVALAIVFIVAIVLMLVLKGNVAPTGHDDYVEQTTLPGEVISDEEENTDVEGLCIYSPDGEYIYYSSDGCVRKMSRDGSGDVVISHGNAYSMTIKDKLLYFISNGKIFCFNTEDDQPVSQVKTKGTLLCYLDSFYSIDTKNGIIYALKDDLSIDKTYTVKTDHLKYKKGYLYYYQEGSNSLIRQKLSSPLGKAEVLISGKDNQDMRFGYQISGKKCVFPSFKSDQNGDINIFDMKSKKNSSIRLDHFYEDFALIGNTIVYSSHKFGTYSCDIDGKNSKKIHSACLYFVNASDHYYAFNNVSNGSTVLYSTRTNKFEYTIKADVDNIEILGDFVVYTCDGKMTKAKLSELGKDKKA